jgi:hypothetical protein
MPAGGKKLKLQPNLLLFLVLGMVILVALASSLINSNNHREVIDPKSPPGVVAQYLKAVSEHDYAKAMKYFAADNSCKAIDLDNAYVGSNFSVRLAESKIETNTALVNVETEVSAGGLLDSTNTESHSYRLNRIDSKNSPWLLEGIPWPLFYCDITVK